MSSPSKTVNVHPTSAKKSCEQQPYWKRRRSLSVACELTPKHHTGSRTLRSMDERSTSNPGPNDWFFQKTLTQKQCLRKSSKTSTQQSAIRVITATQPSQTSLSKKKPEVCEVQIGGGTIQQQFEYAKQTFRQNSGA